MKTTVTSNRVASRVAALFLIVAACGAAVLASCDSSNPVKQLQQIVFPDSGVSYSQHVQPVFNVTCTYSGCHDDASRAGSLSLTSWSNTNADPGNVVPYDPDHSKLVQILERKLIHSGPLDTTQNHIKGIRQWVKEGGKSN